MKFAQQYALGVLETAAILLAIPLALAAVAAWCVALFFGLATAGLALVWTHLADVRRRLARPTLAAVRPIAPRRPTEPPRPAA